MPICTVNQLCAVVVLFAATALASHAQNLQQDDAIVQTKYGPIRGLVLPSARRFQGVPFAKPPLGNLRWKECGTNMLTHHTHLSPLSHGHTTSELYHEDQIRINALFAHLHTNAQHTFVLTLCPCTSSFSSSSSSSLPLTLTQLTGPS